MVEHPEFPVKIPQNAQIVFQVEKVACHLDLKTERIISASRRPEITEARSLISYLAINAMGYGASEVPRALSISRVSARRSSERSEKLLHKHDGLRDIP